MLGFLSRFVDSNDRELTRIQPLVDRVNELEPEMQARSDDEIRALVDELREEIREAAEPEEPSDDERHHPERERRRELARSGSSASTPACRRPWTTSCRRSSPPPAKPCAALWGCATSTSS